MPVPKYPSRRSALFSAISLFPLARLAGQQAQPAVDVPPPSFSSTVKVVSVLATVTDKQGHIVRDLAKSDFTLEEDGQPQVIKYFAQQSDQPLTLGLLVDTSGSERRMIGTEKDASHTFLRQVLRPDKDQAFLLHFDREVELLQDLTSSREALEKGLDQLGAPQWSQGGGVQHGGGQRGGGQRGGTALYDAVYLAANDLMKKQTGRKALVLLTDGEDNGSKLSLQDAITTAKRSETLVYAVRIADEERSPISFGGPGMGRHGGMGGMGGGRGGMGRGGGGRPQENHPDGRKILQQLAHETGGSYFEVSRKKTVDEIYRQIEEELRNQYSLGYQPVRPGDPGQYRTIQVTVSTHADLKVQARDGYYSGT